MIHLVTFASPDMSQSADLCHVSAVSCGVQHWIHNQPDMRLPRYKGRGCGYWAWKPEIILAAMGEAEEGDILIYSDAGVEFIQPVQLVINRMDQDIFLFGNQHEHAHWCKADIIEEIIPMAISPRGWTNASYGFGKQAQASVIFFRVNDYTRAFVKEWLDWCLFDGGRLIDDSPSRLQNHPEFKENRHDQAILTTLAYRERIRLHAWYVKYETYTPGHLIEYPREFDEPLFLHHRKRNHEWENAA